MFRGDEVKFGRWDLPVVAQFDENTNVPRPNFEEPGIGTDCLFEVADDMGDLENGTFGLSFHRGKSRNRHEGRHASSPASTR